MYNNEMNLKIIDMDLKALTAFTIHVGEYGRPNASQRCARSALLVAANRGGSAVQGYSASAAHHVAADGTGNGRARYA